MSVCSSIGCSVGCSIGRVGDVGGWRGGGRRHRNIRKEIAHREVVIEC